MGPFIMFRDLTVQLEAFGVFASPPPPPPPSRPAQPDSPGFSEWKWKQRK
jgi:hypothetical protein